MVSADAAAAFIIANTTISSPPLVPELRLRLASDAFPLWQATEDVLARTGLEPPFWAFCWPGSQAIARLLLDAPQRVARRRVLDLAAGCGIAAIAAAKTGAAAIANDIDGFALAAIALNASLNGTTVGILPGDLLRTAEAECDLILAGDICYERGMAERAVRWLRGQAARGIEVLLADPGRAYCPVTGLDPVARYAVPTSHALEDCEVRECTVWRLSP